MTVGTILGLLASDRSAHDTLADYPYLEVEDIQAVFAWVALKAS